MNPYTITKDSDHSADEKHAAVVYLAAEKHEEPSKIAELTGYALSTVKAYIKKFAHLLEQAKQWFASKKAKVKQYCAYILEFFNEQGEFVFLKIGMTCDIERRNREHLRYYEKKGWGTSNLVVHRVYNVETQEDAEIIESTLRLHYKEKNDCGFIRNDRFTGCRYDAADIEQDERLNAQLALIAA